MIHGKFSVDNNLPYVHVGIITGGKTEHRDFVLDTGFSGDLKMDEQTAAELDIFASLIGKITNANGQRIPVGAVQGFAEMEGRRAPIRILISDGELLAGIGLFSVFGYRAMVDCKNKTAYLQRVES